MLHPAISKQNHNVCFSLQKPGKENASCHTPFMCGHLYLRHYLINSGLFRLDPVQIEHPGPHLPTYSVRDTFVDPASHLLHQTPLIHYQNPLIIIIIHLKKIHLKISFNVFSAFVSALNLIRKLYKEFNCFLMFVYNDIRTS